MKTFTNIAHVQALMGDRVVSAQSNSWVVSMVDADRSQTVNFNVDVCRLMCLCGIRPFRIEARCVSCLATPSVHVNIDALLTYLDHHGYQRRTITRTSVLFDDLPESFHAEAFAVKIFQPICTVLCCDKVRLRALVKLEWTPMLTN